MDGILYYFSGTGNTKWVGDRIKENFNKRGHSLVLCDLIDKECAEANHIDQYDFFVIGTPVYAEMQPKLVDDFVKKLPINKVGKRVIIYSTQGAEKATAVGTLEKNLRDKGYKVFITEMFKISNNYYFGLGRKPTEKVIEDNLNNAEKKVNTMVQMFLEEKESKAKLSSFRIKVLTSTGKAFRKFLPRMSQKITATENCTKCGICLRNCPKNNITFENGHAVFHSNCILCMRCIHICPINSIRYNGKKVEQTQKNIIKSLNLK